MEVGWEDSQGDSLPATHAAGATQATRAVAQADYDYQLIQVGNYGFAAAPRHSFMEEVIEGMLRRGESANPSTTWTSGSPSTIFCNLRYRRCVCRCDALRDFPATVCDDFTETR